MAAYEIKPGERVCLLPRLSLSELIALTGLVRSLCVNHCQVMILAKRAHARSIRNLYGDMPGVRFKLVESWDDVYAAPKDRDTMLDELERHEYRLVPLPSFREACPYKLLGLDPDAAEYEFQLQRNLADEQALYDKISNEVGCVYAVVHDDESRPIRKAGLPENLPVVSVRDPRFRTANIFDWIQTIDRAVQFHGIDSCFMLMADCLSLRARKFLHVYASPTVPGKGTYRDVVPIY